MKATLIALRLLLVMTAITGIIYPLAITGIARIVFPWQASGSMVEVQGKPAGSELIGQNFTDSTYFWPRPSAVNYDPLPSGGSNLGWTSKSLEQQVAERRRFLLQTSGDTATTAVPSDLLFASGSGLDPDITPAAACFQVDRIAQSRGLDVEQRNRLIALVDSHTAPRDLGILGEPRVNVLLLNIALDSLTTSLEK